MRRFKLPMIFSRNCSSASQGKDSEYSEPQRKALQKKAGPPRIPSTWPGRKKEKKQKP
jgi:hypothetical protein